jgi:hypothetical protein
MTPDEFASRMGTLLQARPFLPFTVVLKGNKKIDITNPQHVTFRGGRAYRAVSKRDGDEFFAIDVIDFCTTVHLASSDSNSTTV